MMRIILPITLFIAFTVLGVTRSKVHGGGDRPYINILYLQDGVARLPSYAHYRVPRKVMKK